jgi:hypothetical protein
MLVDEVKRSVVALIELGMQLEGMREQYFAQGSRTDLRGKKFATGEVSKGWMQTITDELGISYKTAERIIERGQTLIMMNQLQLGENVTYFTDRDETESTIESTPEVQQRALAAMEDVVAGTVSAPRAWAGLIGECKRRAKQGGSSARAQIDHGNNIRRAITSLRHSFSKWSGIAPETRAEIELAWRDLMQDLPETIRIEMEF